MVTPSQLQKALDSNTHSKLSTAPRVIPLCASWFLPNDGRNGRDTFIAERIPGARFFDIDVVKDPNSPYPHMLPSESDFVKNMGILGIRRDDTVVVYDTKELGIYSAPRVAWMLDVFGHPTIHILNNFRKWVQEGFPTESGEPKEVDKVDYMFPRLDEDKVIAFDELAESVRYMGDHGADEVQILDARPLGRWKGIDPEPREGVSSGHIPHSISVPYSELLDPDDKTLLSADELHLLFKSKGISPVKPVVTTCGTGVTAAILNAALHEAGYGAQQTRLYDGGWTEWAQRVSPGDGLIKASEYY